MTEHTITVMQMSMSPNIGPRVWARSGDHQLHRERLDVVSGEVDQALVT